MAALARLRYVPAPDWLADFERASQVGDRCIM